MNFVNQFTFVLLVCFVLLGCTKYREVPEREVPIIIPPSDSIGFGTLRVNEYIPKGNVDTNEFGTLCKWFEIYNPSNTSIRLDSNWFFTDTLPWPTKFQVPQRDTTPIFIDSKGFLVVYCDELGNQPGQTQIHTIFKLSSDGGDIALFYKNPKTNQFICVDSTSYGSYSLAAKGIPIGRYPDGQGNFLERSIRTPGKPNVP
jgi:hypothetical protein